MRIGELARRADCPVETVRYYEKEKLLPAPRRSGANYRDYGPSHLERLAFIRRCRALDMSLPEIRAVMAHELGHYVLNHGPKMLMQFGLLILFGLLFCNAAMRRLFARFGQRWGTQSVADVASLPLLSAVFAVFMLLATPVWP